MHDSPHDSHLLSVDSEERETVNGKGIALLQICLFVISPLRQSTSKIFFTHQFLCAAHKFSNKSVPRIIYLDFPDKPLNCYSTLNGVGLRKHQCRKLIYIYI